MLDALMTDEAGAIASIEGRGGVIPLEDGDPGLRTRDAYASPALGWYVSRSRWV